MTLSIVYIDAAIRTVRASLSAPGARLHVVADTRVVAADFARETVQARYSNQGNQCCNQGVLNQILSRLVVPHAHQKLFIVVFIHGKLPVHGIQPPPVPAGVQNSRWDTLLVTLNPVTPGLQSPFRVITPGSHFNNRQMRNRNIGMRAGTSNPGSEAPVTISSTEDSSYGFVSSAASAILCISAQESRWLDGNSVSGPQTLG
jgi:hypothetical protein